MASKSILSLSTLLLLSFFRTGLGSLGTPCGLGAGGFSYDPNAPNGPSQWSALDPNNTKCDNGNMQSPINIPTSVNVDSTSKNPTLNFKKTSLEFECANFNWELFCIDSGNCGTTEFAGETWNVTSQKFHSPSQHTLGGSKLPLEAQTIHKNAAGDFLVLVTFFDQGGDNRQFKKILDSIENDVEQFEVNLKKLVQAESGSEQGVCTYQGSLTTPPCTEGVTWLINPKIQTVSQSQLERYETTTGSAPFGNARPIQSLNSREVTCFVA